LLEPLPDDAAITLTVRSLKAWLQDEPDGADLTLELLKERHFPDRSISTLRSWCAQKRFPGAYKLRGKPWRIPVASVAQFIQSQQETRIEIGGRPNVIEFPDTGAWRNVQ